MDAWWLAVHDADAIAESAVKTACMFADFMPAVCIAATYAEVLLATSLISCKHCDT